MFNGKEMQDKLDLSWLDYGSRMYDPATGKWTTVDPKANKFDMWSPYAFSANSPTLIVDPNGEDWYINVYEKDGKFYFEITVTGVIYNLSGEQLDMPKIQAEMTSQICNAFNFKDRGIVVTTAVNLRVVETLAEVAETDHLVLILNDNDFEIVQSNARGVADLGGLKVVLPVKTIKNMLNGEKRTVAHEFGHTAGLYHVGSVTEFSSQYINPFDPVLSKNNLMRMSYEVEAANEKEAHKAELVNQAIFLAPQQLRAMEANFGKGRLNQQTQFKKGQSAETPYNTSGTTRQLNLIMQEYVHYSDKYWVRGD
jgi:RHS repeat-associated protein